MADQFELLKAALADRYRIERELGAGGMATVYLAEDLKHHRKVAVKVLRPELAAALGSDRFLREITTTARLNHPHILPLHDSGEADGLLYYVMPYVEGETLRSRLSREKQLPLDDALRIAREVADALSSAHSNGVVHRDVKPENILLTEGHAVVADFGIARAISAAGGDQLTETGFAVGTPAYMSPEQASGAGDLDGRSDLYSLGCVLYEMLAGQTPFAGPSADSLARQHMTVEPPPVTVIRPSVPESVGTALTKLLTKTPADRYSTGAQAMEALSLAQSMGQGLAHRRSAPWKKMYALTAVVVSLGALGLFVRLALSKGPSLDANRIMVYPLVTPDDATTRATMGEDMATMIGHALDGRGPLRWIDGWQQLDDEHRTDIRRLTQRAARAVARLGGCGYFMTGRVVVRGDSTDVFLELWDVEGDTTVVRSSASGVSENAWRLGLDAVTGLLPALVPLDAPDPWHDWRDRDPGAVAAFLLAEREFRRGRNDAAFALYQEAVAADSAFAIAAVRGAQAASWSHQDAASSDLIRLALTHGGALPEKWREFARGLAAYLEGRPNDAVAALERALALDSSMAVAWWQLGDVYRHLIVDAWRPDSVAEAAFTRAHALDSTAAPPIFHLFEHVVQRGDTDRATALFRRFEEGDPDPDDARQFRIMLRCIEQGPDAVDWHQEAAVGDWQLVLVGFKMAVAAAQLRCAEAALHGVLRGDTASDSEQPARRWNSVVGLEAIYLMQRRYADVASIIDTTSIPAFQNYLPLLHVVGHLASPALEDRARDAVAWHRTEYGQQYEATQATLRLMVLGTWEAYYGDPDRAAAVAAGLRRVARQSARPTRDSLRTDAVEAHLALVTGDTALAIQKLRQVLAAPLPRSGDLAWGIATPFPFERLTYAKLLHADGDHRGAIRVATIFDSGASQVFQLYLPSSLQLRLDAARALGSAQLMRWYGERVRRLREPTT